MLVDTSGSVLDMNLAARDLLGSFDTSVGQASLSEILAVEAGVVSPFIDRASRSADFVPWQLPAEQEYRRRSLSLEGVGLEAFGQTTILVRARHGRTTSAESNPWNGRGERNEHRYQAMEARLSRTQKRYQTLFNAMNDAVFVYHLDESGQPTTFVDVNDAGVESLGYSREELFDMRLADIADTDRVDLDANLENLRRDGRRIIESWHVARDGRRIAVEVNSHLIELSNMPTVLSICRDITERKAVERERPDLLRREQLARRDAEVAREQLALLVQATSILSDGEHVEQSLQDLADLLVPRLADWCTISILNDHGKLQQLAVSHHNPAMVAKAQDLDKRYPSPPDARYGPTAVVRTGRPEFIRRVNPDKLGSLAYNEAHAEFLHDLKLCSTLTVPIKLRGRTFGALTLIYAESGRRYTRHDLLFAEELAGRGAREIENSRLFRAVEHARDAAEEMSRLKSAFLANMSHEIRTPLTSIIGFASLLEQRVADDHRPLAEYIRTGGKRLLETLDAVLSLSQLESDRTQFELAPINVGALVDETVALLRPRATEKGLTLEVVQDPQPLIGMANSGAVSSVLQNLIGNAIKFTVEGGVTVSIKRENESLRIDVSDTGVGIEGSFLRHVFQPFHQESTGWSRSYEGSGLGLAITRLLIDRMNGRLDVDTEKGRGSRFSFSLAAANPSGEVQALEEAAEESSRSTDPPRILLAEDNPESGMFMEVLLSEHGDVTLVTSVNDAISAADNQDQPFDLLILDINLGNGRTGTDLLEELRRRDEYAGVPAAAVTAYALPEDRGRLLDVGFDAYLAKPFSPDDLTGLAQDLLAGSSRG